MDWTGEIPSPGLPLPTPFDRWNNVETKLCKVVLRRLSPARCHDNKSKAASTNNASDLNRRKLIVCLDRISTEANALNQPSRISDGSPGSDWIVGTCHRSSSEYRELQRRMLDATSDRVPIVLVDKLPSESEVSDVVDTEVIPSDIHMDPHETSLAALDEQVSSPSASSVLSYDQQYLDALDSFMFNWTDDSWIYPELESQTVEVVNEPLTSPNFEAALDSQIEDTQITLAVEDEFVLRNNEIERSLLDDPLQAIRTFGQLVIELERVDMTELVPELHGG